MLIRSPRHRRQPPGISTLQARPLPEGPDRL